MGNYALLCSYTLFIREHNKIIDCSEKHYLEGYKLISLFEEGEEFNNEIFRNNSLFLGTVASLGFGKLSKKLITYRASVKKVVFLFYN